MSTRLLFLLLLLTGSVPGLLSAQPLSPGDNRAGYERADFASDSRRIDALDARAADLHALATQPPLGLPPFPAKVPGKALIDLGRRLFFDRRLSANGTLSCAMCHIPEQGFTQHELRTPVGIEGRSVRRNAPALYNVAYRDTLFHDGRETRLEEQVWFPLLAANEMGNRDEQTVLATVESIPDYAREFRAQFGEAVTRRALGLALASYQRVLLSGDSPFDRWFFGGEEHALGAEARRGFEVFKTAGCAACHRVQHDSALFSDGLFHDTGIGYRDSIADRALKRLQIAPGVAIDIQTSELAPRIADHGRMEVTGSDADRWRYRTPTLRNIALTAPYMHDGSLAGLEAVVDYYDGGGEPHAGQDPRIRALHLDEGRKRALLAFLRSLSGSNVAQLAEDARSAGIGDVR